MREFPKQPAAFFFFLNQGAIFGFSKKKLKKAEEGPQTSQRDLLNLVFKVFNNWEEQAKLKKA